MKHVTMPNNETAAQIPLMSVTNGGIVATRLDTTEQRIG